MNGPTLVARPDLAGKAPERVLDYYTNHSVFSTPGRHAALLDALSSDPASVARVIQGLVIYEHVAEPFYGCPLTEERRAEGHIRPVENIIDALWCSTTIRLAPLARGGSGFVRTVACAVVTFSHIGRHRQGARIKDKAGIARFVRRGLVRCWKYC